MHKGVRVIKKQKPVRKLKNRLVFVRDHSASMAGIKDAVLTKSNSLLETHKKKAKETNQDTRVSLIEFSTTVVTVFEDEPIADLEPGTEYRVISQTALLDAIGHAVDLNAAFDDADEDHVSHLIMVLTDGNENCSSEYTWNDISALVAKMTKKGNWTFVFEVPPGARRIFENAGIPPQNIREWEATPQGVREATYATDIGTRSYYESRTKGARAVNNFYTDLSDLKTKDLRAQLKDCQAWYQSYAVPKEVEIRPFVEAQTGRPYLSGEAFYQLTKPETIQWRKDILIREKGKRSIWGGDEARNLIGLQPYIDAKVKPGNHANFDIFVQSTSTNRKLVRGTTVLVRK